MDIDDHALKVFLIVTNFYKLLKVECSHTNNTVETRTLSQCEPFINPLIDQLIDISIGLSTYLPTYLPIYLF